MPLKKKAFEDVEMDLNDSSDSDLNDADFDERNQEIQVDFEGRNPIDTDFHGIRQLMNQLFQKSNVDISELADYIIGQNYIGSVVTQCDDDEDDEDEDDDMIDSNVVFGVTTAVNLKKTEVTCIKQILTLVMEKAKENGSSEIYAKFKHILEDTTNTIGFLLNERYVNIPPQISVPLMDNLVKEIERANKKKMPFQFTHYLMMLKFYKMANEKRIVSSEVGCLYSNAEEEIFANNSIIEFEFAAQTENETDSGDLQPYRKVILFDIAKFPQIIESIKKLIE